MRTNVTKPQSAIRKPRLILMGLLIVFLSVVSMPVHAAFLDLIQILRDGLGGVEYLDGARQITLSPDGSHVYVASTFDNAISVFERDMESGMLALIEVQRDGQGGVSPNPPTARTEVPPPSLAGLTSKA